MPPDPLVRLADIRVLTPNGPFQLAPVGAAVAGIPVVPDAAFRALYGDLDQPPALRLVLEAAPRKVLLIGQAAHDLAARLLAADPNVDAVVVSPQPAKYGADGARVRILLLPSGVDVPALGGGFDAAVVCAGPDASPIRDARAALDALAPGGTLVWVGDPALGFLGRLNVAAGGPLAAGPDGVVFCRLIAGRKAALLAAVTGGKV